MKGIIVYSIFLITILLLQDVTSVAIAPLDVNDNIHHTLDLVSSLVGIIGGGLSSLVFELTGISLTDCALTFKDVDTDKLTCQQFLDLLSTCESLSHVKPLLKKARRKYMKTYPTRASKPCSRQ